MFYLGSALRKRKKTVHVFGKFANYCESFKMSSIKEAMLRDAFRSKISNVNMNRYLEVSSLLHAPTSKLKHREICSTIL